MNFIAHRGNLIGPNKYLENTKEQAEFCIYEGFDVELDVWCIDNKFYLGHDEPGDEVDLKFLSIKGLWLHCKNMDALIKLKSYNGINCFYIGDTEHCAVTTDRYIWLSPTFQNRLEAERVVCVMPEDPRWLFDPKELVNFTGICTDRCYYYRKYVNNLGC